MMRKVSIHQEYIVSSTKRQTVHIGGSKTKLSSALQDINLIPTKHSLGIIH